jgi:hypothetical protein
MLLHQYSRTRILNAQQCYERSHNASREQSLSHRIAVRHVWPFGVGTESGEHKNTARPKQYLYTGSYIFTAEPQFLHFSEFYNHQKPIQIITRIGLQGKHFLFTSFPYCAVVSPPTTTCADGRCRRKIKEGFPAWRKENTRGKGVTLSVCHTSASVLFLESRLYPSFVSFKTTTVNPTPSCSNGMLA